MKIISGSSHPHLAKAISVELGIALTPIKIQRFADHEIFVGIEETVRGEDVFVVQPTSNPANDHIMELLIMIDALKRASAGRITAVIPYFGYSRQDRKTSPRTPISAKLVADMLTAAGAHRVLTVDLHSAQAVGFFNVPVDHLTALPALCSALPADVLIVSPDMGGIARARQVATQCHTDLALIDKRRISAGQAEVLHVVGNITGRNCILVDDMVDSGNTLILAANALMSEGARSVSAIATHGVLSGDAIARISKSVLENLIISDTIAPAESVKAAEKLKLVSIAPLLAQAITKIANNQSVSTLFAV